MDEHPTCPHCGSDTYEYIVRYTSNLAEIAYCTDCWEDGYLVKEWNR